MLELSMVLIVVATVIGITLQVGRESIETARISQTKAKLEFIKKVINRQAGQLHCPADPTLSQTDANYGHAAQNMGNCLGETPAASYVSSDDNPVVEGAFPFHDYELPEDYMYDGWGRKFNYSVLQFLTRWRGMATYKAGDTWTGITVKDESGGNRSTTAAWALISYGANGHGAFTKAGARFSSGSTDTDEQSNCNCDSDGDYDGSYEAVYVQKLVDVVGEGYDDILVYGERYQMQEDLEDSFGIYRGPEGMVSHDTSPYVTFVNYNNNRWSNASVPSYIPTGPAHGVAISDNARFWAVVHDNSPFLAVYERDPVTGDMSRVTIADSPEGDGIDVKFAGDLMVVAHDHAGTGNYISFYVYDDDGNFTKIGTPTQPSGTPFSLAVDDVGKEFVGVCFANTYLIYRARAIGGMQVYDASDFDFPPVDCNEMAFSRDGKYLFMASDDLYIFEISRNPVVTFTRITTITSPYTLDTNHVDTDFRSNFLFTGGDGTDDSLTVYRINSQSDTFTNVPIENRTSRYVNGLASSENVDFIAMAGDSPNGFQVMGFQHSYGQFEWWDDHNDVTINGDATGVALRKHYLKSFAY